MVQRDLWKQAAKDLAALSAEVSPDQIHAWSEYKKFRNKINNRKKNEEQRYKSEKMAEVADSPDIVGRVQRLLWAGKVKEHPINLLLTIP